METITIILGVALIFVAAYAADRNESAKTIDSRYWAEIIRSESLEYMNSILEAELSEAKELRTHLEEQLEKANSELVGFHLATKRCNPVFYDHAPLNQGQKPAEVIKIEPGDDFKELKAAVDSLGSINVLKTELDRAHKREAIYMKRLLVSNAAILAASKKA